MRLFSDGLVWSLAAVGSGLLALVVAGWLMTRAHAAESDAERRTYRRAALVWTTTSLGLQGISLCLSCSVTGDLALGMSEHPIWYVVLSTGIAGLVAATLVKGWAEVEAEDAPRKDDER